MNRIIPGLIWLILWLLSWLPGFALYFLAYLIKLLLYRVFRYRKEVVDSNLSRSFPGLPESERKLIAARYYQHLAELFPEMVMTIHRRPDRMGSHIRFSNPEIIEEAFRNKQNFIVLTGHLGNYEWTALPLAEKGYRVIGVFKPQSSQIANKIMSYIRDRPQFLLVPMKEAIATITRELKDNPTPFAMVLISDQIPALFDIRFWTMFLHQETAFFTGGELIARRFGLPVYYFEQEKPGFADYVVNVIPMHDGTSVMKKGELTQKYTELLEASIRRTPHLWLWSHRRWKYHKDQIPRKP